LCAVALAAVQINTPFGSGIISDTTGILFGNTMDDFASPAKYVMPDGVPRTWCVCKRH
jgi:gamma-glutamyltranspeptidase